MASSPPEPSYPSNGQDQGLTQGRPAWQQPSYPPPPGGAVGGQAYAAAAPIDWEGMQMRHDIAATVAGSPVGCSALGVAPSATVGVSGLELALDDQLRGVPGGELIARAPGGHERVLAAVTSRPAPANSFQEWKPDSIRSLASVAL